MSSPRSMYLVSGNSNKVKEVMRFLPGLQQLDIDLPEVQSMDPKEIIESKLFEAMKHVDGLVVVEDTSLSFDCLGGLPGPFIKFFQKSLGNDGIADLVTKYPSHAATARTVIGLGEKGKQPVFFEGSVRGNIVPARGESAFGWDPIFEVEGTGKTYAEMTFEEKQAISHRAQAVRKLVDFLK